jgi:hypothetical protein
MTRSKFFIHSVITAVIAFSLLPLHNTFAAPVVSTERPTVALNATVRIVDGKFGRANIVALVGGTLTIVNKDSTPYALKRQADDPTAATWRVSYSLRQSTGAARHPYRQVTRTKNFSLEFLLEWVMICSGASIQVVIACFYYDT